MKRVWLSALVGLVLLSWQDILIWQRIFEANGLYEYAGIYHRGWFVMLWALMLLGFVWLWPKWQHGLLHGAMLYTLFFGGLPDVLYYWLAGRPIPAVLPWLDAHPWILFSPVTSTNLIVNIIIWIIFWLAITLCAPRLSQFVIRPSQKLIFR